MDSDQHGLEKLFNDDRIQTNSFLSLLAVILYFPLGVLLFVIRLVILLQAFLAAAVFPHGEVLRRYILRCMSFVLGLGYEEKNKNECNNISRCVYVANHVTTFDNVAFHLASGSVSPSKYPFPSILHSALGLFEVPNQMSREDVITAFKQQIEGSEKSLLLFPELTTTSGKTGMLKFTTAAFSVQDTVQPVALKVCRPSFLCVAPSVLESTFMSDLFWFLFTPYTKYCIRYLPPVRRQEGEDLADFAKRAQESIALSLNLAATNYGAGDKMELIKRRRREQAMERGRETANVRPDPHLIRMANQVKEILPHVPVNVILQDLRRTKSVDVTVSHLVEGLIPFTPEPVPTPTPAPSTSSNTPSSVFPPLLQQGSSPTTTVFPSDFHKNADDRQLSLQERKARLLDNARRAYIEKHGLKIPGYNC